MGTQITLPPRKSGLIRWTLEAAILLAIAATIFGTWFVEGLIVPVVVSSGSMAPALLGPHYRAECPNCGMTFDYDADAGPTNIACPNCGAQTQPVRQRPSAGDRLLIDRATFGWRSPRRWEIGLFRCPDCASDYCVKRIVGLPGESIDIRDGDVYVNGQIARKTLAEQRAMAILVHDTAWQGAKGQRLEASAHRLAVAPTRWQSDSGWQPTDAGYTCDRSATPHSLQFLGPVRDDDAYNPQSSRQLNDVADLMLVAHVSAEGPGRLVVTCRLAPDICQVTLTPSTGELKLQYNGGAVTTTPIEKNCLRQSTELVVSLIDRQVIVALGGRTIARFQIEPGVRGASERPLTIAAENLAVRIDRLQVWRDVYVTAPPDPKAATTCTLGADEYFVVGDNSPASLDSRRWTDGAPFKEHLLVGKPLFVMRRD